MLLLLFISRYLTVISILDFVWRASLIVISSFFSCLLNIFFLSTILSNQLINVSIFVFLKNSTTKKNCLPPLNSVHHQSNQSNMADEEKIENDENKSTFKMTGFSFKKIAKPKSNLLTTKQLPSINDLIDIHDPDDGHGNDDKGKDFITSIDNNEIQCSNDEQQSIIIPLIKVNKYRNDKSRTCDSAEASPQLPLKNEDDCDDDLITKAKQELLEESRMIDDDDQLLPAWKSLMINKLPDEFKNDTKLDISMRPEVPKLNDYEQTPLNVYGAAMLRGMGWKEDGPIGGKRKAIAPIIEHQLRPRGIGIGADISLRKQLEQKNNFQKTTTGGGGGQKDEPILRKGQKFYHRIKNKKSWNNNFFPY